MKTKKRFLLTLILGDDQQVTRVIESTSLAQAKKNGWASKKKCGAVKYTVVPFEEPKQEPVIVTAPKVKGKRGRKKLSDKYTRDEIKDQIKEDLVKLQEATESKDLNGQKKIRRRLRRRGWKGGLSLKLENFDQQFDAYMESKLKEVA